MGEQKKLTCIVLSKAEKTDGFTVELEIPAFNSKYPTFVNRVSGDIASRLQVGQPHSLILETQNTKKNQDGTYKTGQWPTDYYYGLVAIDGDEILEPQPARFTPPATSAPRPVAQAPVASGMTKDEQIARSVALKAAVDYVNARKLETWEAEADAMLAWLMNQPSALEVEDDNTPF